MSSGITEAHIYGSWAARYSGEARPCASGRGTCLVVGAPDPDDLDEGGG